MLGAIDSLKDNAALTAFITENANGTVSTVRFAQLIQELYPVTIADNKIEEALSACTGIENISEEAREAYASFVSGTLAVDDSCKAGNQLITRGQALLIADKLADYQMNYLAEHTQTQKAEVARFPERMEQLHCQQCLILHLIKNGRILLQNKKKYRKNCYRQLLRIRKRTIQTKMKISI